MTISSTTIFRNNLVLEIGGGYKRLVLNKLHYITCYDAVNL